MKSQSKEVVICGAGIAGIAAAYHLAAVKGLDEVLIVDEPTRGVDVGARSEIYTHLRALAEKGVAIILISSDLLEILGLSDRILVMRNGRMAGEFAREDATEEKVIACAAGLD